MAATLWWLASIPGNPSIYVPPHISYMAHMNSMQQPPQSGIWDYNTWDYIRSQVTSIQAAHATLEDPGDSSSSSRTPRSNTGHPIGNQVTPMQMVRPNLEDTKNIEEPSSLPSTPRSDTSICSMGILWRMAYNIEQCRQDEESDRLKDDCWQLREDKDYLVKEFRTNMD